MTMANVATLSAKNEVFSAVERAVSVTQILRAAFGTGLPVALSIAAALTSLVGLPVGGQELAHLRVQLAAGGLERVLADAGGEQLRLGAGVDRLVGDLLVHVGRADDLLLP